MGRNNMTPAERREAGKKAWRTRQRKKREEERKRQKEAIAQIHEPKKRGKGSEVVGRVVGEPIGDTVHVEIPPPGVDTAGSEFKDDFRKSNPGLHMLHTKWAVRHMTMINEVIRVLRAESSVSMIGFVGALQDELEKKIKENAAWADANAILDEVKRGESHVKGLKWDDEE